MNDLLTQAKSAAKTARACTVLAARGAGTVADKALAAAGLITHAVAAVTTDRARAVSSAAAEKAQPVLEPLGFTHARDSKRAAWRVIRYPQFRHFLIGSIISNWGTWLQNTAQMLLAYKFTHSVLTVGLVTCAQFSTPLFFAPWASVVADRIGARRSYCHSSHFSHHHCVDGYYAIYTLIVRNLPVHRGFRGRADVHVRVACAVSAYTETGARTRSPGGQQSCDGHELGRLQCRPDGRASLHHLDRHDCGFLVGIRPQRRHVCCFRRRSA